MSQSNSNLFSALQKAKREGYTNDFFVNEGGQVMSEAQEISNPHIIEMIPCISCGATLYLIAGDGKRGTWVHHWEI